VPCPVPPLHGGRALADHPLAGQPPSDARSVSGTPCGHTADAGAAFRQPSDPARRASRSSHG
jgi:hypothetical protein